MLNLSHFNAVKPEFSAGDNSWITFMTDIIDNLVMNSSNRYENEHQGGVIGDSDDGKIPGSENHGGFVGAVGGEASAGISGGDVGKGSNITIYDNFDTALNRELNQGASIGEVKNKLEFTSNNITTSSNNLQPAESTYKDADMVNSIVKENYLLKDKTLFDRLQVEFSNELLNNNQEIIIVAANFDNLIIF